MAQVKIGFRRLYEALGLRLSGGVLKYHFDLPNGIGADAVVAPDPQFGIWTSSAPEYICFEDAISPLGTTQYFGDYKLAKYPCKYFTDIVCTRTAEFPDEVARAFHSKQPGAELPILEVASQKQKDFRAGIDITAGLLGLRLHRQLVMKQVCEEFMAFRENDVYANAYAGPAIEIVDALHWESRSSEPVKVDVRGDRDAEIAQLAFPWLLQAWRERNSVRKFIALFTPLEVCLAGLGATVSPELIDRSNAIEALIAKAEVPNKDELIKHLQFLTGRINPSLVSRFESLAKASALPGFEKDILGFKRFYGIRNALIHRGVREVSLVVNVGEQPPPDPGDVRRLDFNEESSHLEDLVERYVCYRLCGDAKVYRSKYRPDNWAKKS
jgi:hypothetical protein